MRRKDQRPICSDAAWETGRLRGAGTCRTAGKILLISQIFLSFPISLPPTQLATGPFSLRRGALWLPPPLGCLLASGTGRGLGAWAPWAVQGRQGLHLASIHCHAPQETAQSGLGLGTHATSRETEHQCGALGGIPTPLHQDLSASTGIKAKGGRREPRAWNQAEHQRRGLGESSTSPPSASPSVRGKEQ